MTRSKGKSHHRRDRFGHGGTDASNAYESFERAERAEGITVGDYSLCKHCADPWKTLDLERGSDVEIHQPGAGFMVQGRW